MFDSSQLQQRVRMAPYTTMQVGGEADFFVTARTKAQVQEICDWAAQEGLVLFALGEGSNIVVSDTSLHLVVLKVEIPGFEVLAESRESATIRVGAGEHWDDVVKRTVDMGLAGIETMSAIPGTAGAAPVQNAGAYGQEVSDTLLELEAYDQTTHEFTTLKRADCGFAYRTSIFKGEAAGRYVIVSVTLRLSKRPPVAPTYKSLQHYLAEHQIENPSLEQIRTGVMAVRARILPDPSVVPNTGSFFKNPIVGAAKLAELEQRFSQLPSYQHGDNFKIAAGWIVEQCGFKGSEHFGLVIHPHHALVITNPHGATYADLVKLVDLIVRTAQERFGITLEPEPLFVH